MARTIVSIGVEVPGGDVESIEYSSSRSLLDADIILFAPKIPLAQYETDTFQGKTCLSDDYSFRAKETNAHWRSELKAALEAGKLVVVFLIKPEIVFAATGEERQSGTGRNARTTRIVSLLSSYDIFEGLWRVLPASGTEMEAVPDARFFNSFWHQFSGRMAYEVYFDGDVKQPILRTRAGRRVVGLCIRSEKGSLIAIPPVDFNDPDFVETKGEGIAAQEYWTDAAERFGKRFISGLCALASSLASDSDLTPPPDWSLQSKYILAGEQLVRKRLMEVNRQAVAIAKKKGALEDELLSAGALRGLLYEKGKTLENVVLQALAIFGFEVTRHKADDSEFDAVFISAEGRFLGEVEGKDNRAINIDKFSQLERNLSEDFQREEVTEYAKGVLFGNAFRLQQPGKRAEPFTAKCVAAAKRLAVALVSTPDMFEPARYLASHHDKEYAAACRRAIFDAAGDLVRFPDVPSK